MAYKKIEKITHVDSEGNESTTEISKSVSYVRNEEPDYIKLYTKMWLEMNEIPLAYRGLFLELVCNMSYSYAPNMRKSQMVNTGKPWSDFICEKLGWGQKMYEKALRELVVCGAIKRLYRGVYQINPSYAGKGEWLYNPKLSRGGIKDLKATFGLKDKTAEVEIIWADDGEFNEFNKTYREGLEVEPSDETVLTFTKATPITEEIHNAKNIDTWVTAINGDVAREVLTGKPKLYHYNALSYEPHIFANGIKYPVPIEEADALVANGTVYVVQYDKEPEETFVI